MFVQLYCKNCIHVDILFAEKYKPSKQNIENEICKLGIELYSSYDVQKNISSKSDVKNSIFLEEPTKCFIKYL